ncbi:MAG: transporter substrate-binding domain-containing protein [Prevotellaceae bacterium]|jgi:membrane-bound lytic murein transglycosylase F|nr:transporter substrate-binding domain-containing protein [Prevotellaceae bacterium]
MKNITKIGVFLVISISVLSCNKFCQKNEQKELCVIAENNILGYAIKDSVMQGFQYEIIKNFADSFDYQLNIILSNNLETSLKSLQKDEADILLRCLPTTLSLKKEVDFTTPLYISHLVLVQQKREKKEKNLLMKNISDLEGKTIFINHNSPYIKQLQYIIEESGIDFKVEKINISNFEKLAENIVSGKISYLAIDKMTAKTLAKINTNLDYDTALGLNQFMAWAVGKSNPKLKTQLDAWLEEFLKTEKYREIARKYQ